MVVVVGGNVVVVDGSVVVVGGSVVAVFVVEVVGAKVEVVTGTVLTGTVVTGTVVTGTVVAGRVVATFEDAPESAVPGESGVLLEPHAVRRTARSRTERVISSVSVVRAVPAGGSEWKCSLDRVPRRRAPGFLRTAPWRSSRCARARCHSRRR
jgi:hypothetical protein